MEDFSKLKKVGTVISDKIKNTNKELITSLEEYFKFIELIKNEYFTTPNLWYRGINKAKYNLVPGLYRYPDLCDDTDCENCMRSEFIHKAKSIIKDHQNFSQWEWYQIMQHYGLPTRLLDWTEGHLIALYFAVRDPENTEIPSVWVLDPFKLNLLTSGQSCIYFTDKITRSAEDVIVEKYLTESDLPEYPISLNPPYVDKRLNAQKSCFTIHGTEHKGIEKIAELNKDFHLFQIRIDTEAAATIKEELFHCGIDEQTVFPDLDGLAKVIKYKYKIN